jgi:hypothetical protein
VSRSLRRARACRGSDGILVGSPEIVGSIAVELGAKEDTMDTFEQDCGF